MQGKIIDLLVSPTYNVSSSNGKFDARAASIFLRSLQARHLNWSLRGTQSPSINNGNIYLGPRENAGNVNNLVIRALTGEHLGDPPVDEEEDDELCPVECVREFKTDEEFSRIMDKAKATNALVVVDFYRTSCGSCKYIEQGFSKLCKASGEDDVPVIFLKHNVMDEYDEQSEVADRLRIKKVPLFHFYKNGTLLEAFATRDKEKITEAIMKYSSSPQSGDN